MTTATPTHRPLTGEQIQQLVDNGCSCADWSAVLVDDRFRPVRVRNSHFAGSIQIGDNSGSITNDAGVERICGIFNAALHDCTIGNNVRIANVGVHIAKYNIADGVCIESVGTMETRPGATFGNGVEVEPLNEGGGRELILFNDLDAQIAYLMCVHRYRTEFIEKLSAMAKAAVENIRSDRGTVGPNVCITDVHKIVDVNIGDSAIIDGAALLRNGSIVSAADAPATVGAGVIAEDFIIQEASAVDGGAMLGKAFVGQGCQIGKQYSAEGSVFFANCEGFHGEACSVFAGPYTVSHHKSSLLIAALYSFYNAGSGTNASNHMYKLGPVHEGRLERGSKTGSFSYMMWPCRIGPFSVVLGKHTRNFDTSDFPFSHIEASAGGRCSMIPGFNLSTVGTVRDGAKWPARDRRKGIKRDRITFDVLSPLTVGRMLRGSAKLKELQDNTDRSIDSVTVNGAEIRRVLLRSGQKFYRPGIQMYLLEKVVAKIEQAVETGVSLTDALATSRDAVFDEAWIDVCGQMMPRRRMDELSARVASGQIIDLAGLGRGLDDILAAYEVDEWAWVKWAFEQVFGVDLDVAGSAELADAADTLKATRTKFIELILIDASKEFDDVAKTGFGQDGTPDQLDVDFSAVRGEYEANAFVKQMKDEIVELANRIETLKVKVASL